MVNRDGLSRGQYLAELVIAYAKAFGKSLLADRAGLIDAPDLLLPRLRNPQKDYER